MSRGPSSDEGKRRTAWRSGVSWTLIDLGAGTVGAGTLGVVTRTEIVTVSWGYVFGDVIWGCLYTYSERQTAQSVLLFGDVWRYYLGMPL